MEGIFPCGRDLVLLLNAILTSLFNFYHESAPPALIELDSTMEADYIAAARCG